MDAAMGLAGGAGSLDILGGVFGFLQGGVNQDIANTRADMLTTQAEYDAKRYMEQAEFFSASQRVAYAANGVKVSGSPVDVMDHTMLLAKANSDAIIANGIQQGLDQTLQGIGDQATGRNSLLTGLGGAMGAGARYADARPSSATPAGLTPGDGTADYSGNR